MDAVHDNLTRWMSLAEVRMPAGDVQFHSEIYRGSLQLSLVVAVEVGRYLSTKSPPCLCSS